MSYCTVCVYLYIYIHIHIYIYVSLCLYNLRLQSFFYTIHSIRSGLRLVGTNTHGL